MQWWQFKAYHVEPVKKIFPKGVFFDRLFKVTVGGGYDSYIDRNRLGTSYRSDLPVLEYPQQLDLNMQRHITYFIEKEGAVVGRLKEACVALDRSGERSFHMAKQFRLQ